MKSFKNLILIIALLFSFPASAFMADVSTQGKVIINVYDEKGNPYVGNWYLHQGVNGNGLLIRNGSSGETFLQPEGKYFLIVYKNDNTHPYHIIHSANPQTLAVNETITFNVQYFKTEEEMANTTAPAVTEPAPVEPVTTSTPDVIETTDSTDTGTSDSSDSSGYSRTYMGPRVSTEDLPNADTSPATDTDSSFGGSEDLPLQLAQTGSPVLMIFLLSGLLGGIVVRRKK